MSATIRTLLLLLLAACAPAVRSAADLDREVLDVQRRRFEAMTRNDLATLDDLLRDDLSYTHSSGVTETKEQFLQALRSGQLRYLSMRPQEVLVRHYGETALLSGRSEMRVLNAAGERSFTVRFLEVYVREHGRWRLAGWQSTRLPE